MSRRPRVVVPEILDGLPHDDPDAIASRRDLRRVNSVMGNPRWILRMAGQHHEIARRGVTEIGAGDGRLACQLAQAFPDTRVTAIDFAPAPCVELPPNLEWRQGDMFEMADDHPQGGLLVACLILHHFESPTLQKLGREFFPRFDALAFVEPDRRPLAHFLGRLAWPFINRVTRHDMHVSIDAGFAEGELLEIPGLDPQSWRIEESRTLTGARRMFARRC